MTAEITLGLALVTRNRPASMRPRSNDRGNPNERLGSRNGFLASMRPRSNDRGNDLFPEAKCPLGVLLQ